MLVFIDESGDTGRKITQGSSRFFVISLILFEDNDEALVCEQQIDLLRKEMGKPSRFEFHFQDNSDKTRLLFLKAIAPYAFTYFSVVIDKDPNKLIGQGFGVKESFYKYACNMVFTNAKPYLNNATVILDKTGSATFQASLKRYLTLKTNGLAQQKIIKKIKQQRSSSNNLLQLADYVSGVINRKFQDKKSWKKYYKFINSKEIWVQKWPK